jgi:hypothetical protein
MWRYPFGSGGKRVTTSETLPSRTSAATISRMKSLFSGVAGLSALTALLASSEESSAARSGYCEEWHAPVEPTGVCRVFEPRTGS